MFFVSDGGPLGAFGLFTVTVRDGVDGSMPVTATVSIFVSSVQINVLTDSGYNFESEDPIAKMGLGVTQMGGLAAVEANATANTFFIVYDGGGNPADDRIFQFEGDFAIPELTGFITKITEKDGNETLRAEYLFGSNVLAAQDWLQAVVTAAQGNRILIEALSASWNFNVIGNAGDDFFGFDDQQDFFAGRAGDDTFDGGGEFDRANYTAATGPILVDLASGTVMGDSSIGIDTLRSIEFVGGTEFDDIFIAIGFSSQSANAGSSIRSNVAGTFNQFEGRGGDDTILGNDNTRVSYAHAFAGVTVYLDADIIADGSNPYFSAGTIIGTAFGTDTGDVAGVGTDTFSHVNRIIGSYYDDIFFGSDRTDVTEFFEGRGGDDVINGEGGFDVASYGNDSVQEDRYPWDLRSACGWESDRRLLHRHRHLAPGRRRRRHGIRRYL